MVPNWLGRLLRKGKAPPIIMTPWGPVTEWARLQAAMNIRSDPAAFDRVLNIIVKECGGSEERGLQEMRRRYPEAFDD